MQKTLKLVVLGIVENEKGEILISQRFEPILPEVHLKWDLPGGKNEFGESLENTIVREIKEETGLKVEVASLIPRTLSKVWEYKDCEQHTILVCFLCKLVGGELHLNDEKINDLKWISNNDVDKFYFMSTSKEFIEEYLKLL